jgi:hypothetical protein
MHDRRGKVLDRKRAAEAALAPADLPEGLSAARRSAQARRIVRHALVLERCLDSARFPPPSDPKLRAAMLYHPRR